MVADNSSRSRAGEFPIGHRGQPDVGIEPDLVAGVSGQHRTTARLRHVADHQPRPAELRALGGQALQHVHQVWVSPVSIARQPHHLPGLAVDRQRLGAGETALGIESDDARRERGGRRPAAEQSLRRRVGIVRIGKRRQRLRIDVPRSWALAVPAVISARQCQRRYPNPTCVDGSWSSSWSGIRSRVPPPHGEVDARPNWYRR